MARFHNHFPNPFHNTFGKRSEPQQKTPLQTINELADAYFKPLTEYGAQFKVYRDEFPLEWALGYSAEMPIEVGGKTVGKLVLRLTERSPQWAAITFNTRMSHFETWGLYQSRVLPQVLEQLAKKMTPNDEFSYVHFYRLKQETGTEYLIETIRGQPHPDEVIKVRQLLRLFYVAVITTAEAASSPNARTLERRILLEEDKLTRTAQEEATSLLKTKGLL